MTTKVTVTAHCADDVEVHVEIHEGGSRDPETAVLQHGESRDYYVYDDREIRVKEVHKAPAPAEAA